VVHPRTEARILGAVVSAGRFVSFPRTEGYSAPPDLSALYLSRPALAHGHPGCRRYGSTVIHRFGLSWFMGVRGRSAKWRPSPGSFPETSGF
jgi:hypothetical protein